MRLWLLTTMVGAGLAGCDAGPCGGSFLFQRDCAILAQPNGPVTVFHAGTEDPVIVETFGADGVTADFVLTDVPDPDTLVVEWFGDGVTVVPDPADVTYDRVRNSISVVPTPAAGATVEVAYLPLADAP